MAKKEETQHEQRKGIVKWFNDAKGYGFIQDAEGGEDVFVHFSVIGGKGFRSLREGEQVTYSRSKGDKGWQALSCTRAPEA